jgi:hypothetical protein
VAVVLHALEQRLDRLGPKVHPLVRGRERVRLVDEEDAVERPPDHAVCLQRRRPDVLSDEPGAVDLDEMTALEESHRLIHLRQQTGHGRLSSTGIAEEDEMLRGRHLRQAVALALRLHLQEGDERPNLLLDGLEAD